jgi:serine/alanine adding enzyme
MIDFIALTPENQHLWNEYAEKHPHSEVFHLAQWATIYKETYNYTPHYFFLQSGAEIIGILPLIHQKGLLKNILVSPPAGILLCHPKRHSDEVCRFVKSLQKKLNASDVVFYHHYKVSDELYESLENIRILKQLPETVDALNIDIGKKRRWGVRKAEENGLTHTVKKPTLKDLKLFYKIYSTNYRDLGTPVNSEKFFRKQMQHLGCNIKMLIVSKEGKPICVKWLLEYKRMILSSDSATLREFFHTRINDYQVYHALKYAIENGFQTYNMGRSQQDSGTHAFKISWGACQVQPYPVYRMKKQSGIAEKKSKFKLFIKVWQKTPVAITNIAGPILRKNMALD